METNTKTLLFAFCLNLFLLLPSTTLDFEAMVLVLQGAVCGGSFRLSSGPCAFLQAD